jgi:photosystem II stability/assembly factor-like uncharacterized protein
VAEIIRRFVGLPHENRARRVRHFCLALLAVAALGCRSRPYLERPDLALPPPPDFSVIDFAEPDFAVIDQRLPIDKTVVGPHWVLQESPTQNGLFSVWGSGGNDVYAVGQVGTIIHTADHGKSWQRQESNVPQELYSVRGSGPNDVWAVGISGMILHSTGGGIWSVAKSPTQLALAAVWAAGPGEAWAVGQKGTILKASGGVWSALPAPTPFDLWGVWGIGKEVFVVGDQLLILSSSDGGASWRKESEGAGAYLLAAWGYSENDLFIVGQGGALLHSAPADGGRGWVPLNSKTGVPLEAIYGVGDDIFSVGDGAQAVHSSDRGKTWEVEHTPAADLDGVWGTGPLDMFAVGIQGLIVHREE